MKVRITDKSFLQDTSLAVYYLYYVHYSICEVCLSSITYTALHLIREIPTFKNAKYPLHLALTELLTPKTTYYS